VKDISLRFPQGQSIVRPRPFPAVRINAVLSLWIVAAFIGLVTLGVRAFRLNRSFDIFIDEVTYLRLSQSVAESLRVTLYGKPFYLHPPAFFFLEGAYLTIAHPAGSLLAQIYAVRFLNLVLAALSSVALLLIGRRLAGWTTGVIASLLFAFDPFIIAMNSRNLLDTCALCFVLAGYCTIVLGLSDAGQSGALSFPRAVSAGLFFGLAILTKDMMAVVTLGPLATCFVLQWSLSRRTIARIGFVAALTYAPYPFAIIMAGEWDHFARQKFHGIARLVGLVQETGFHRHTNGGPTLLQSVVGRLEAYGTTYVIIALGALATYLLLRHGRALEATGSARLVGVWAACSYALLGYCIAIGTLEEQFFYILTLPSLLIMTVVIGLSLKSQILHIHARIRRTLCAVTVALTGLFMAWAGYHWVHTRVTPDNAFERAIAYIAHTIPSTDRHVASTSETGQFLLIAEGYASGPWGVWHSAKQLQSSKATYVLIDRKQLVWDEGNAGLALLHWVQRHGQRVFLFHRDDTDATDVLMLYRLNHLMTHTTHHHVIGQRIPRPTYVFGACALNCLSSPSSA